MAGSLYPALAEQLPSYVAPVIAGDVQLSGLGFMLPASLAFVGIGAYLLSSAKPGPIGGQFRTATLVFATSSASVTALAYAILPDSLLSGAVNFLLAICVIGYLSYMLYHGERRFVFGFALAAGFALGLISDLVSLRFAHGVTFGGNGVFDADFIEPAAMLVGAVATERVLSDGALRRLVGCIEPTRLAKAAFFLLAVLGMTVLSKPQALVSECGGTACIDIAKVAGLEAVVVGFCLLLILSVVSGDRRATLIALPIGALLTSLSGLLVSQRDAAGRGYGDPIAFFTKGPSGSFLTPFPLIADCMFWFALTLATIWVVKALVRSFEVA